MKPIISRVGIVALLLSSSVACGQSVGSQTFSIYQFAGLKEGMTKGELKASGLEVSWVAHHDEDGENELARLVLQNGIELAITFNQNGDIYKISSETNSIRWPRSIGPGSQLREIRNAWPEGQLFFGEEEGGFVTFDSGSRIRYNFSINDISPQCLVHDQACVINEDMRAVEIVFDS